MSSLWVLLLTWLSFATVARAAEICPLCETVLQIPKRFEYHVGDGRTCLDVYLDIAQFSPGSAACISEQSLYRVACCGDAEPAYIPIPPTQAPVYSGPVGDEPDCPVCGTLERPGNPTAFVKARYVGDYNCAQLYDRGLHGLIPWFMCGPLQDFTESVCGCGAYNPKCQADPSKCWGQNAPAPSPVSQPVRSPATMVATEAVSTVYGDRKVRPSTSKAVSSRLSDSRGGSGGSNLRSRGRLLAKGEAPFESRLEEPHAIQEVENEESMRGSLQNSVEDVVSL